jgi:hypothetical protein
MSLSFAGAERSEVVVGRTPWSAADALVGLPGLEEADFNGEGPGPGGPAQTRGSAPRLHLDPRLWEN